MLLHKPNAPSLKPKLSKEVCTELVMMDKGLPYSLARFVLAVIRFQKYSIFCKHTTAEDRPAISTVAGGHGEPTKHSNQE